MMPGDSSQMGNMQGDMQDDTARATGDSALVNQAGDVQPGQSTMQNDTIMGDSTLTGQANDTRTPDDSSMMPADSTMSAPGAGSEDAIPTDSAQGQRP